MEESLTELNLIAMNSPKPELQQPNFYVSFNTIIVIVIIIKLSNGLLLLL